MQKRQYEESDFQLDFRKWSLFYTEESTAFELKVSQTRSLNFLELKRHQLAALLSCKRKLFYKISDADMISRKPFDCFILIGTPAYVVVMFQCTDRGQKEFFMIDAEVWAYEEEISSIRSLTIDRAREIGLTCNLK